MLKTKKLEKEIAELKKKLSMACQHKEGFTFTSSIKKYTSPRTGEYEVDVIFRKACKICGYSMLIGPATAKFEMARDQLKENKEKIDFLVKESERLTKEFKKAEEGLRIAIDKGED